MTRDPRAEIHADDLASVPLPASPTYAAAVGSNDRLTALRSQLEAADALAAYLTYVSEDYPAVAAGAEDLLHRYYAARDAHLNQPGDTPT
jgi:hypothetical protein